MEETAEQELARRLQQPAATQSSVPYSACSSLNAVNVLRTDFDTGDQCYVFHVAASMHTGTVAAALSNHTVKLYNARDSGGFTYLGELKGHADVVSEIAFAGDDEPHALYSSSEDGSIRGWDSRTGQQAQRCSQAWFQLASTNCSTHPKSNSNLCCSFASGTGKLFSLSLAGNQLAAGSEGQVLFWDKRSGKQCGAFTDTHAEDVTQASLHTHLQLVSAEPMHITQMSYISTFRWCKDVNMLMES